MNIANPANYVPDVYTDVNGLKSLSKTANSDDALKEVSKQFESLFINIMLKNMRQANAVFEEGNMLNSNESRMFRDMYDNQLSLTLAKGNGVGIADTLYRQLKDSYGQLLGIKSEQANIDHQPIRRTTTSPLPLQTKPPASESDIDTSKVKTPAPRSLLDRSDTETEFSVPEQFVNTVFPIIQNAVKKVGLNPYAVLAQSVLETGWGKHFVKSADGENSHNLFNIKADKRWQGESASVSTLEYKNGVAVQEQAQFRKYRSFEESIQDYVDFLSGNARYSEALKKKEDPEAFIQALQTAGYATDPNYANKVSSVMNSLQPMIAQSNNQGD